MNKIFVLAGALVLAGVSTSAMAQGGFVRFEAGSSRMSLEGDSEHDNAWSLRGGYAFNKNVAIEGFYSEGFDKSQDGFTAKLDGVGVGVVGKKNFGANDTGFFIDGRVGIVRNNLKFAISGVGEATDHSTKPYVGVGVGYDFSPQWGVSLNYDWNKVSAFDLNGNVKTLTAGVEYRF